MDMLTLSNVSKSFGNNKVIDNISLSVPEHSISGFIGRNGAGKTTTMKMILGLLKPDNGEIFVNGKRVDYGQNNTNRFIGYLPDVPEFYGFMTPKEYLMFCGEISEMPKDMLKERIDEVLLVTGLDGYKKRIRGFSRGMKQRLGFAQALLNSPKFLICDEPTSALDPLGRNEILNLLSEIKNHTTIFFSTHILSDAERICDEISFLNEGKIVLRGPINEVKKHHKGTGIEIGFFSSEDADLFAGKYPNATRSGNLTLEYSRCSEKNMVEIMHLLSQNNIAIQKIEMLEPTLEDLFMEVIHQ